MGVKLNDTIFKLDWVSKGFKHGNGFQLQLEMGNFETLICASSRVPIFEYEN